MGATQALGSNWDGGKGKQCWVFWKQLWACRKRSGLMSEDSFLGEKPKPNREPSSPVGTPRGHVLSGKLVQPLEELILHLQILHDGLHYQVCAVNYRRCIRAGRNAAQRLLHKFISSLTQWKEGEKLLTGLIRKLWDMLPRQMARGEWGRPTQPRHSWNAPSSSKK